MMATQTCVKRALSSQRDLIDHREHCSIDSQLLADSGISVGHQLRVIRGPQEYALYTVSENRKDDPTPVLRMGLSGRQRLDVTGEFEGEIDLQVPHPTLSDLEAENCGEFVERLDDSGRRTRLIVIAPHGGDIERHTDQQAERVAARLPIGLVSSWRCKGWKPGGGAFDRWHITSVDINENSFPLLNSVMCRGYAHAVAFHGFEQPVILVGGTAAYKLKHELVTAIAAATAGSGIEVRIARPTDKFGGDDPLNVVNRLTVDGANGIQIEQSLRARTDYWAPIADAVADVYATQALPTSAAPETPSVEVSRWLAGNRRLIWASH
jgi:phage replication-related protein YjqB (UPF0714/DUF867 family)